MSANRSSAWFSRRTRRAESAALGFLLVALTACGAAPKPAPTSGDGAAASGSAEARNVVVVDRVPRAPGAASPPVVAETTECDPFRRVVSRAEGDLTVDATPGRPSGPFGRLRSQAEGALTAGSRRVWVGPPVPGFVPLHEGTTELMLLETTDEGFAAVYRDPYGAGTCALGSDRNCRMILSGYDRCGKRTYQHDLARFMQRPDKLEVQDVRAADGVVYFNEACQSYSREAGGQCSSLVAIDPAAGKLLWRTGPLVSNNRFLVAGPLVVTGYGFTSESDSVFLVRRSDGKVLTRARLPAAHEAFALQDDLLTVIVYPGDRSVRFRIEGADTQAPRLVPAGSSAPIAG